mgnify:CR=1 FL=1
MDTVEQAINLLISRHCTDCHRWIKCWESGMPVDADWAWNCECYEGVGQYDQESEDNKTC